MGHRRAGLNRPVRHFRTAELGPHSPFTQAEAVAVVALAVDRPEIGDLAIGGDVKAAQEVLGVAGAGADDCERDGRNNGADCSADIEDTEDAGVSIVEHAHAVSFRAGVEGLAHVGEGQRIDRADFELLDCRRVRDGHGSSLEGVHFDQSPLPSGKPCR